MTQKNQRRQAGLHIKPSTEMKNKHTMTAGSHCLTADQIQYQ